MDQSKEDPSLAVVSSPSEAPTDSAKTPDAPVASSSTPKYLPFLAFPVLLLVLGAFFLLSPSLTLPAAPSIANRKFGPQGASVTVSPAIIHPTKHTTPILRTGVAQIRGNPSNLTSKAIGPRSKIGPFSSSNFNATHRPFGPRNSRSSVFCAVPPLNYKKPQGPVKPDRDSMMICGGYGGIDLSNPDKKKEVEELAAFAFGAIAKRSNGGLEAVGPIEVLSAAQQVVAGMNYDIRLKVNEKGVGQAEPSPKVYDVTVFQPLPHTKQGPQLSKFTAVSS